MPAGAKALNFREILACYVKSEINPVKGKGPELLLISGIQQILSGNCLYTNSSISFHGNYVVNDLS